MFEDYPAAHSMDTSWFAVDQNGYVGYFDSGEDGAVPYDAPSSPEDQEGLFALFSPENNPYDFQNLFDAQEPHLLLREVPFLGNAIYECVLKLASENSLKYLQTLPLNILRLPTSEALIVYVEAISLSELKDIHQKKHCLNCIRDEYSYRENGVLHLTRLGFFQYDNDHYGSLPYDRISVPKNPIKVDDLPLSLWKVARPIIFSQIDFFKTEQIQPLEHFSCARWGSGDWIGSDGKTYSDEGVLLGMELEPLEEDAPEENSSTESES